ncbi:MAG: CBS domain-containing protein [Myxococcales bacterium]|nr:CBS domain-containing protein [Myxococcales bacterium]
MKVKDVMQRKVTTVAEDDKLGLALQLMLWNEIRHLPVLRAADGRVTGIVSERDVLRARQGGDDGQVLERQVREFMTSPVDHIHPNAELADAAADLSTRKLGCLPVVDGGELVGIVTVSDLLGTMAQSPLKRSEPLRDGATASTLMQRDPITAHADDGLLSATSKMMAAGVRHLVVVDADGQVLGIVSDRDVRTVIGDPVAALEAAADGKASDALQRLRVEDAMTPDPRTVPIDENVRLLLDALLTDRFGALPVVDAQERLVGIVSYIDVLRHVAAAME